MMATFNYSTNINYPGVADCYFYNATTANNTPQGSFHNEQKSFSKILVYAVEK